MSSSESERLGASVIWAAARLKTDSDAVARADDETLIARVQGGDEAALGQLLERHARVVIGIGSRILRDPGEAQELVQSPSLLPLGS